MAVRGVVSRVRFVDGCGFVWWWGRGVYGGVSGATVYRLAFGRFENVIFGIWDLCFPGRLI